MGNILITGGGTGLGRALAHKYAAAGHHVFLIGRTKKTLSIVQNEIKDAGRHAEILICDITEPASVSKAVRQIDQVDVLINNAGLGIFGKLSQFTNEDIDQMLFTNVKGTILMTQKVFPKLQNTGGRVLNIISTAGLRGKNQETVYCASKFAVRGFTESLQKEWAEESVTATAVYMGGMNTPFWQETNHVSNPEKLKDAEIVADQIFNNDDGREAIYIDK